MFDSQFEAKRSVETYYFFCQTFKVTSFKFENEGKIVLVFDRFNCGCKKRVL